MSEFENEVFESIEKKKLRIASKVEGAKLDILIITPAKLKSQMYKIISKYTKIYSDRSWENIHKLDKELNNILPNLNIIEAKYGHDEFGVPNSKKWHWVGVIETPKKTKMAVLLDITAHGAGSVKDPLDKYDITAVVNILSLSRVRDLDVQDYLEQYNIK